MLADLEGDSLSVCYDTTQLAGQGMQIWRTLMSWHRTKMHSTWTKIMHINNTNKSTHQTTASSQQKDDWHQTSLSSSNLCPDSQVETTFMVNANKITNTPVFNSHKVHNNVSMNEAEDQLYIDQKKFVYMFASIKMKVTTTYLALHKMEGILATFP